MNQLVTVAKIVGPSGAAIVAMFRRWTNERVSDPESPTLMSSEQWPKACLNEMDRFADSLRENAAEPPVAYYAQFADHCSTGYHFASGFPETGLLNAMCTSRDLFCHPLPDDEALAEHLRRMLRRRTLWDETRRYLESLMNALAAWRLLADDGALVVVRDVVGGFVTDEEFEQAARTVPKWIRRLPGQSDLP